MTSPLIIISFTYVCPAASSGARTAKARSHIHGVTDAHFVSTRTWSQNFFTYSETRRATRPGPSIIHMPESIDFGVQGCSSAQQSEDITVTRGHDPQWILKCFKATAARPVRNTRDLLNCVHYKCKVVNGDSQLRALLPQVVHLQASTNLKKCKIITSLKKTSFKISLQISVMLILVSWDRGSQNKLHSVWILRFYILKIIWSLAVLKFR